MSVCNILSLFWKKNSHSSSEWIYKSPYTAFPCQVALQWSKDLPQLLKVLVHPNCVNGNASIKRIKSFPLICKQSCKVHSNSPKQKKHLQLATTFPIRFSQGENFKNFRKVAQNENYQPNGNKMQQVCHNFKKHGCYFLGRGNL